MKESLSYVFGNGTGWWGIIPLIICGVFLGVIAGTVALVLLLIIRKKLMIPPFLSILLFLWLATLVRIIIEWFLKAFQM